MKDQLKRLERDVQTIETALGLDIWTRRDVRRGFLGAVSGVAASVFLAIWMYLGGAPEVGMLIYVAVLQAVIILKAIGYRANPSPSPGTQREVGFYNRYYYCGTALIVAYYFWAQWLGIDLPVRFASVVVISGMWYLFYGISSLSRSLSTTGAVSLIVGGFILPEARTLPQMFCWLGIIAAFGCSCEAMLLYIAFRHMRAGDKPPSELPTAPSPEGPVPAHVAH